MYVFCVFVCLCVMMCVCVSAWEGGITCVIELCEGKAVFRHGGAVSTETLSFFFVAEFVCAQAIFINREREWSVRTRSGGNHK